MKRPNRYFLTYAWTSVFDMMMWVLVILIRLTAGTKLHWNEGPWCEIRKDTWLYRKWAVKWSGITLGHGGVYGPGRSGGEGTDTVIEAHEHVHVEQYEAAMLLSFVVAIVMLVSGSVWWVCVTEWLLGGATSYGASLVQAWLRGENPYLGSHLEESAYSQTKK